jgi:hypothetical protein
VQIIRVRHERRKLKSGDESKNLADAHEPPSAGAERNSPFAPDSAVRRYEVGLLQSVEGGHVG